MLVLAARLRLSLGRTSHDGFSSRGTRGDSGWRACLPRVAQPHVYGLEPCKLRRPVARFPLASTYDAAYGESPLGVCASHSQSSSVWWLAETRAAGRSNELMSFGVSELTRGVRSAWRCARKASCESGGCCDRKRCSAATTWTAPRKSESIGLCGDLVIVSAGLDAEGGSRKKGDGLHELSRGYVTFTSSWSCRSVSR